MTFTSLTFIIFLALVFPLYWTFKDRFYQNVLLLCVSYFFYGWWDFRFCLLMFATSILDYGVGLLIYQTTSLRKRRWLLVLNIICNLTVLGFFKYFNFFADNFQILAESLGWQVHPVTLRIFAARRNQLLHLSGDELYNRHLPGQNGSDSPSHRIPGIYLIFSALSGRPYHARRSSAAAVSRAETLQLFRSR